MFLDRLKKTNVIIVNEDYLANLNQNGIVVHSTQRTIINGVSKVIVSYTSWNTVLGYNEIVRGLVKDRYTIEDEIALTNKGIANPSDEEYIEYRNYVAECKNKARVFIEERYNAVGK